MRMYSNKVIFRSVALITLILSALYVSAEELSYRCEFGLQGGLSYYVGDATPHIFMNPQYAAGAQFRYKFTPRWALQVKGQWQQIKFPDSDEQGTPIKGSMLTKQMIEATK